MTTRNMSPRQVLDLNIPHKEAAALLGVSARCVAKARQALRGLGGKSALGKVTALDPVDVDVDKVTAQEQAYTQFLEAMEAHKQAGKAYRRWKSLVDEQAIQDYHELVSCTEAEREAWDERTRELFASAKQRVTEMRQAATEFLRWTAACEQLGRPYPTGDRWEDYKKAMEGSRKKVKPKKAKKETLDLLASKKPSKRQLMEAAGK